MMNAEATSTTTAQRPMRLPTYKASAMKATSDQNQITPLQLANHREKASMKQPVAAKAADTHHNGLYCLDAPQRKSAERSRRGAMNLDQPSDQCTISRAVS